ncbi:MAG: O-antigen ligase family protein [Pseudomonadota bacterium]
MAWFGRDRLFWVALLVVLCFVAVLILPSQSRASYPSYLLAILMLATLPAWRDFFNLRIGWVLLCFLGWMALSTFWSEDWTLRRSFSVWVRCLLVFLFVVAVAECRLRGQLQRWMARALTGAGVIVVLAAIGVFFWTDPEDGRLNGLGQLDTHVIAALVFGVVLLFVMRFVSDAQAKSWQRYLGVVIAVAIVMAIYLSDSRNAWVSVTGGAIVFLLAHKVQDPKQFLAGVAGAGVLLVVMLVMIANHDQLGPYLLPRGDSFRLLIWQEVIGRLDGHWLFGRGILTTDDVLQGGIVFQHPHSMYLSVVYQAGIVGLVLFFTVLGWTIWTLMRHYYAADAKLALSILALALSAYVLDGHELVDKVGSSWFLIWFPMAIAIGFRWAEPDAVEDEG